MTKHLRTFAVGSTLVSALVALSPVAAWAWGAKGHDIQARVAVAALPADLPPFFRNAVEELAFLINEPDRWRTPEQPSADETTGVNHTFKWGELAPKPLPANRHLFIVWMARQPGFDPATGSTVRDFGTAPYGLQEWAELLTAAFRRWRAMPESTPVEITQKRTHETTILLMAGVLAHWVGDVSNPIHASIHVHGWHPSVPNPNGYAGPNDDPHGRYEGAYVNRAIEFADVAALVDSNARLVGDWLREAETYIAASAAHVEEIYRWDKQARFGTGQEPAAAKFFTASRIADGARMLRDIWYTAWARSGMPVPRTPTSASR